jgi:hypothetical protein
MQTHPSILDPPQMRVLERISKLESEPRESIHRNAAVHHDPRRHQPHAVFVEVRQRKGYSAIQPTGKRRA